jgi:Family of unknown function (DUF6518)
MFTRSGAHPQAAAVDRPAPARAAARRDRQALALAVAIGVLLGAVGRWSDHASEAWRLLFALGSPWVVAAFGVGLLSRAPRRGALLGAVALVVSVLAYYAIMRWVEQRGVGGYAAWMMVVWGAPAAAVGAVFGAAGAAARSARLRPAALALLGGTLAGEALLFLARASESGAARAVLLAQLALGVAAALGGWGRRPSARVAALAGGVALFALVADAAIRVAARRYGWGG